MIERLAAWTGDALNWADPYAIAYARWRWECPMPNPWNVTRWSDMTARALVTESGIKDAERDVALADVTALAAAYGRTVLPDTEREQVWTSWDDPTWHPQDQPYVDVTWAWGLEPSPAHVAIYAQMMEGETP